MTDEQDPSPLESAAWMFFEQMLSDLPITTLDLPEEYGVELMEYYSYVHEREEFEHVSNKDFTLYRELEKTYLTECNCQQHEPIIERFDSNVGASRLVSEDGKWLDTGIDQPDDIGSSESDEELGEYVDRCFENAKIRDQLFEVMLKTNGLGYIGAKPRTGAHFVKGWAAPFSNAWYAAECTDILASIVNQTENSAEDGATNLRRAYNLGRAHSDWVWRERHFQTSQAGGRQLASLQSATRKMAVRSVVRGKAKHNCLKVLWHTICKTDPSLSRFDSKAADAIYAHVSDNLGDRSLRPLIVKKTGAPIAQDAIRRHLKVLRDNGAI